MRDEKKGEIMKEYARLRPKMYFVTKSNNKEDKEAKSKKHFL